MTKQERIEKATTALIAVCRRLDEKVAKSEEYTKKLQALAAERRKLGEGMPREEFERWERLHRPAPTVTDIGDEVDEIRHLIKKIPKGK